MKELKYIEKIRNEESLLSLPQSLSEILNMVGGDHYSMGDLAQIIMKDPGLTSKVIKMANSAFYHQHSQIKSVNQAVILLGIMQVKCLALSASLFQEKMLRTKYHINISEIFSHFISVAVGSKLLAEAAGMENGDEAFTAGMLHDIGLVYFIHHFPEDYHQVILKIDKYSGLIAAEQDILGVNHADIGRMLAEKWNFPKDLCEAIGEHNIIPEAGGKPSLASVVQLSVLINKPLFEKKHDRLEIRLAAVNSLAKLLKVERSKVDEVSYSLLNETLKIAGYLGIDIGDPSGILARANHELFNSYLTIERLFRERQDLSRRILDEERRAAMLESKNVAIATLSHYLNNAFMAISGRAQLLKMLHERGGIVDKENRLENIVEVIDRSVKKVLAVLFELRALTNIEEMERYSESQALNFDERIRARMAKMELEDDMVLTEPESE